MKLPTPYKCTTRRSHALKGGPWCGVGSRNGTTHMDEISRQLAAPDAGHLPELHHPIAAKAMAEKRTLEPTEVEQIVLDSYRPLAAYLSAYDDDLWTMELGNLPTEAFLALDQAAELARAGAVMANELHAGYGTVGGGPDPLDSSEVLVVLAYALEGLKAKPAIAGIDQWRAMLAIRHMARAAYDRVVRAPAHASSVPGNATMDDTPAPSPSEAH